MFSTGKLDTNLFTQLSANTEPQSETSIKLQLRETSFDFLFEVRAKEAILVSMALTLLVCSILLFFKHWKKNYRDINQLPYYAYLYQKEEVQFEPEVSLS